MQVLFLLSLVAWQISLQFISQTSNRSAGSDQDSEHRELASRRPLSHLEKDGKCQPGFKHMKKSPYALNKLFFCFSALRTTTKVSNIPINFWFKAPGINWLNGAEPNRTSPSWDQGDDSSYTSQIICSLTGCRNTTQMLINDILCECSDCWL